MASLFRVGFGILGEALGDLIDPLLHALGQGGIFGENFVVGIVRAGDVPGQGGQGPRG